MAPPGLGKKKKTREEASWILTHYLLRPLALPVSKSLPSGTQGEQGGIGPKKLGQRGARA